MHDTNLSDQANPFKNDPKRQQTAIDATPPNDDLAARTILGTLIVYPELFYESCIDLQTDDFYTERHRRIYRALLALYQENEPVSITTVMQQLQSTGELEAVGGIEYLSDLVTNEFHYADHIEHQVKRLIDLRKKRRIIASCDGIKATAYDQAVNSDAAIDRMNVEAMELACDYHQNKGIKLGDLIQPTIAEWRERAKIVTGRDAVGLTFGLRALDKITTGMWPKELTLLGGHTKDAKTATAISVIISNLKEGVGVFYASHEMSREQVLARIMAQEAHVQFNRLRDSRQMAARDWAAIESIDSYLRQWPLIIDDSPMMDIGKLVALGRLYARREGCKLMVVDYLQRVHGPGERKNEVVSNVSHRLCALAKEENIHVLLLSQLTNPMTREREKVKPNLRMFRDSGDPVQDAHVVLAVWRPESNGAFTGEDEILILAQRSGPGGCFVNVQFDHDRLCYTERTPKQPESQKGLAYDDWSNHAIAH